jgi:hypothetical protein
MATGRKVEHVIHNKDGTTQAQQLRGRSAATDGVARRRRHDQAIAAPPPEISATALTPCLVGHVGDESQLRALGRLANQISRSIRCEAALR